jgi:N,N'-diacetylchitobiose transport system permease protein
MLDTAQAVRRAPGRTTSSGSARPARRRPRLGPYLLILPALVTIGVLLLWPVFQIARMSFQDVGLRQLRGEPAENVGLDNYRQILGDGFFWTTVWHTVLFAAVTVTATLVVGTLVGLLLNQLGRRMSAIVAGGVLIAWATPPVTAAVLFAWLFGTTGGLVGWLLDLLPNWLVGGGWQNYNWFSSPLPDYTVLTICVVWMSFPFIAVSVLAGLRTVPGELYEAAKVDGAGVMTTFWKISFPMLRPVFGVMLALSVIWDFRVFTQLFVLSGLANSDSYNLSLYAYSTAFGSLNAKYGLGSAIAMVLTVIVLIVTTIYTRMIVRQEGVA